MRGKKEEAFSEYQLVAEQDPLDVHAQTALASAYRQRGRFDEAAEILDNALKTNPSRPVLHWHRGILYFTQGDYQSALDEFSKEKFEFLKITGQAMSYHHLQQKDEAVAALQSLISTMGESASYQIAAVYAQWGDPDNAMSWLERGYNIRDPGLQYINMDFLFDPISEDPRFQAFLRKMNF